VVPVDLDLAKHAGRGRELVLETRGYEQTGEADRAWWGAPVLTVDREAPWLSCTWWTRSGPTTLASMATRARRPPSSTPSPGLVVFDAAVVHASWTKPSVASISPPGCPAAPGGAAARPLDASNVTIAQRLDERGWATGAAIANSVIYGPSPRSTAASTSSPGCTGRRPAQQAGGADVVVDSALAFLRSRRGLATFLFVHTMDPHVPYEPPAPFDRMFQPFPPRHPAHDPEPTTRSRSTGSA